MADIKKEEEAYKSKPFWLVLNQITTLSINNEKGDATELNFNKLGFQGMCPIFDVQKVAEDYAKENNNAQIVSLGGNKNEV